MDAPEKLLRYLRTAPGFELLQAESHNHMGAIIADAVLSAGINYENVVKKRVLKIRANPSAETTSGFLDLLRQKGPESVLAWRGGRKVKLVVDLTELLNNEGVETTDDLRVWLSQPANLGKLEALNGVGPKTVDYLKSLAGIPAVAVNRQVERCLERAGIVLSKYQDARAVVEAAADRRGVSRSDLDYSIWKFMTDGGGA